MSDRLKRWAMLKAEVGNDAMVTDYAIGLVVEVVIVSLDPLHRE